MLVKSCRCFVLILAVLAFAALVQGSPPQPHAVSTALSRALSTLDMSRVATGILYDRVLPLSNIDHYKGTAKSKPVTLAEWKQMYFEMYRSSLTTPSWPKLKDLMHQVEPAVRRGVVPVAFLNLKYDRLRPHALDEGALLLKDGRAVVGEGNPFMEERVFSLAALKNRTYRGAAVVFSFNKNWYTTNDVVHPRSMEIDFADGIGFRVIDFDRDYDVHYSSPGRKVIRAKFSYADGTTLYAATYFQVERLETPDPNDTLDVISSIPYQAEYGTGQAYVYLANGHSSLTNPVIVIEGFDLDNSMNWDELYSLLNQQGLVETLRTEGFDAVVLNFTDATDYIQKNSYVVIELIEQVQAAIDPLNDVVLIGASMGGLASRYALAYMETHGLEARVRTFISFDAPQEGANIPLGIQYWMDFFADQSEDAAFLLSRLDTPAARQMLVYHHTNPPGSTGESDPLRGEFLGDLAGIGQYPSSIRMVAIANGSGEQADQGFAAGDQIISYEYYSFLVDVIGNVWAVPEGEGHIIFDGLIDIILLPPDEMSVTVSGTLPYDNAPGGWRASMAQMDSTEAPYGDIVALYNDHCFIPTISALAIDTDTLFYDVASDYAILYHTPFDVVYYPTDNQEHMTITTESADWFLNEIRYTATGVSHDTHSPSIGITLYQNYPNPFNPATTIGFYLPEKTHVNLGVYDPQGRLVVNLINSSQNPGYRSAVWDGKNTGGTAVSSGIYFCRLEAGGFVRMKKMVLIK